MNSNLLKIVFLTIVGLGLITYITAPKNPNAVESNSSGEISLDSFPSQIKVVGKNELVNKNEIFKQDMNNLVVVVNHDSIAVMKDLKKYANFDNTINPVLIANISAAPWFIKKWVIPSKMEELNQNSGMIMVYDEDGFFKNLLNITNNTNTHFVAFIVDEQGKVSKIKEGDVKEGALDGSMSDEDIQNFILDFIEEL